MELGSLNLAVAFGAGTLSFVSPCVLPLVPAYLTYITGLSAEELGAGDEPAPIGRVLPSALAFVLGLAVVLSIFGLGVTALGQTLFQHQAIATKVAGAVVIVLGLHTAGLIRIPLLYRERRVDVVRFRGRGMTGAFLMGGAFAIGWTPCVGAILGGILTLASQSETLLAGTTMLFAYSLGLGVPFVLVALGIKRAVGVLHAVRRQMRVLKFATGALLVGMGVLLFTDQLLVITLWFTYYFGTGLAL